MTTIEVIVEDQKKRLERYASLPVEQQRNESEQLLMEYARAYIKACEIIKLTQDLMLKQKDTVLSMSRRIEELQKENEDLAQESDLLEERLERVIREGDEVETSLRKTVFELRGQVKELEQPIPVILHCPSCRWQHVDLGEWATLPHRKHRCEECGREWRVSNRSTVGVAELKKD